MMDTVRPAALAYLGGSALPFERLPAPSTWPVVSPGFRRLDRIEGVGRSDLKVADSASPLSEPLLAGLAGESIPLAFQVIGAPSGVAISVGTWVPSDVDDDRLDRQHEVVTALVDGLFPAVDRHREPSVDLGGFPAGGLAHGVPRLDLQGDGPAPWDRLLRSLAGASFAVLVLAEPIAPQTLETLRNTAVEDSRAALVAEEPRPGPLARLYAQQLDTVVASLTRAHALGGWRVAVYLLGDRTSYWRLAAAWRAGFADGEALVLPVRTAFTELARQAASAWALPYAAAPAGPRSWQHPFLNQTLLDSRQLAALAHLPRLEAPGFTVRPAPEFAVSRAAVTTREPVLRLGEIVARRRPTGRSYDIGLNQLTRHGLIAGLTGSGKSNTLMHLLSGASDIGVPFLVIEPAKTEYRELLRSERPGSMLRVFTVGRETVAPLRLNPLEIPDGVDVATHLDLVKSVFMGSFAMWIPLPQVLEQCLVELYTERGWSFSSPIRGDSMPTLSDLVVAVERIVPRLGYKAETAQEISASLSTRLNALRRGARGLMLDVEHSVTMEELLSAPTVVELEGLGDDDDKAFLMGLLLTRLYEHRRAEHSAALAAEVRANRPTQDRGRLRHLVVVEEAHRLLGSEKKMTDSWNADPRGAFVSTFTQMLAEVRAYGQAIVIADQVPVRLAPEVLKNTNLKVAHRIVSGDDRDALAEAMSMTEEQSRQLATLPVGRALMFSEGDHMPLVVQVPPAKDRGDRVGVDDAMVAAHMAAWREGRTTTSCPRGCTDQKACAAGRELAADAAGRLLGTRLFHSGAEHPDGVDAVWPDVTAYISGRSRNAAELGAHERSFLIHAGHDVVARRARQGGWSAQDAARIETLWRDVIGERLAAGDGWLGATAVRSAFVSALAQQQHRSHDPYPLCSAVCTDARCPYRHALLDVELTPKHRALAEQPTPLTSLERATYAADDVIDLGVNAPSGAETLQAGRWRAIACATQMIECRDEHPTAGAVRAAAAVTDAGWPLSAPNKS